LDGPKGEATWAVMVAGEVVGSVRLKRTAILGVLETGIWLSRRGRGQGIGTAAVSEIVRLATVLGAAAVCADTTSTNVQALAVLKRIGFNVGSADSRGSIQARMEIQPSTAS
jgi:RimJ/RimL family protein N-acetyltransferase